MVVCGNECGAKVLLISSGIWVKVAILFQHFLWGMKEKHQKHQSRSEHYGLWIYKVENCSDDTFLWIMNTLWPSAFNILFRSVWSLLFQHTLFFLKGSNPFINLFDSFMSKTELNYYNNILKMHTAQLTQDIVTSLKTWQPETPSLTVAQNLLWYRVHSSSGANPVSYPMDNFPNGYVCLIFVPKLRK